MQKFLQKAVTSLSLLRRSCQVIREHKKLLAFPVLTFACAIVLILFFIAPIALVVGVQAFLSPGHWAEGLGGMKKALEDSSALRGLGYAYAAGAYLMGIFGATFLNVAFYHEIMHGLSGEPVSIRGGLAFAGSRVRAILLWSLLAGTVGLLIQAISERLGWVGKFVMRFVGMAWSLASIFVIPVLIREKSANPFVLLRNSAGTLKRSWGEGVFGYVGLSAGTVLAALAVLLAMVMGFGLSLFLMSFVDKAFSVLGMLSVAGGLMALFAVFYLSSMANCIYTCALYIYATEGVVPGPFTAEEMNSAWKIKAVQGGQHA